MNPNTVIAFFAQSGALIVVLAITGYPIARLLQKISGRKAPIATPLLGLYPITEIGWLWSRYGSSGLHIVLPSVVVVAAALDAVIIGYDYICDRRSFPDLPSRQVLLFVAMCCAYVVIYHAFFSLSYLTNATLGNADAPHFSFLAEHLRNAGFNDVGRMYGTNLGQYVRGDVVGTFIVTLLPSVLLHQPIWKVTSTVAFCGMFLITLQLWQLVRRGLRTPKWTALLASLATMVSPLAFFVLGNGYISQLYATALLAAGITVFVTFRLSKRSMLAAALGIGLISAVLWQMYPFTAVVLPVLAVPLRLVVHRIRRLPKALLGTAVVAVVGLGLSGMLAFGRFPDAYEQVFEQGTSSAGFPLPVFSPNEVLGFTSTFKTFTGSTRMLSIIPVIVVVLASLGLWKRITVRLALGLVVTTGGSYVAIALHYGASYQQWKWAALIGPFISIALAVLVMELLAVALRKLRTSTRVARAVTAVLVAGVSSSVLLWNSVQLTRSAFTLANSPAYITPDMVKAASNRTLQSQPMLYLRGSAWEVMWFNAMFPHAKVSDEAGYGWYTATRPSNLADDWILESTLSPTPPDLVTERIAIGSVFQAVRRHPPSPAHIEVLTATKDRDAPQRVRWSVEVTNLGNTTWTSPKSDPKNGIALLATQVKTLDLRPGDTATSPLSDKVTSTDLPAGTSVRPGRSYTFTGSTEVVSSEPLQLQFDLQQGNYGPFELWTPQTVATVGSEQLRM